MYKIDYVEIMSGEAASARQNERFAFEHVIGLLRKAEASGPGSLDVVNAIYAVTQLWTMLLDDLTRPDNGLEESLRGSLISIGIFILKEAERVRQDESGDIAALIDINKLICEGLK